MDIYATFHFLNISCIYITENPIPNLNVWTLNDCPKIAREFNGMRWNFRIFITVYWRNKNWENWI